MITITECEVFGSETGMAKRSTEENQQKRKKPFKLVWAKPSDPIFTEGFRVGQTYSARSRSKPPQDNST